ncbi:MAG: hypothetical protein R3C62_08960 [Chloroflexota bacterium]
MRRCPQVYRCFFVLVVLLFTGCQPQMLAVIPTVASVAEAAQTAVSSALPPTFTPAAATPLPTLDTGQVNATPTAKAKPGEIPTQTAVPPTATLRPTATTTPPPTTGPTLIIKPFDRYPLSEIMPYQAFPTPTGNNGWGIHWIPTIKQEPGVVDQFVAEVVHMNIKWVVFLNDGVRVGDNDYLVDQLVAHGIMPVMRLFQPTLQPYDGDIGGLVRHYRARGVYYYQIYNEPNTNVENTQSFANPNLYAAEWARVAREVVANGGLPGIGALSPGGEYNHYDFLDRTLRALEFNGDDDLLNHAWLSVHNYHGLRPFDDPDGFLLFRQYDSIVQSHLGRSLPIIGTEAGSYNPDNRAQETELIRYQYGYMATAEPYFLAFSYWLLANRAGGGFDDSWEWQALFQPGFTHPAVTEFFYHGG